MQYLKYKDTIYTQDDFTQRIIKSTTKGSYASAMFDAISMTVNNTEGLHLVCIASYRNPNIFNGIVESFDYFPCHIGYYKDVKTFLNLNFEEHDDNRFIFIPVTVENGTAEEIIEDIKKAYPDDFSEKPNPLSN